MPSLDKIFEDVQLNIDFAKEIDGASKLDDVVLYSNLIPSETASSGANTNNIAVSFAKLYAWAQGVFTFNPTGTKKIEIKSSALPSGIGNTYLFQEGSIVGAFQVKENQGSWQTIAIHNGLHAGDSTTNPAQAANVRLTKGSVSGDLDDTVEFQWNNGSSWSKISSVALGLLDSNNKILEKYLPSYVDDVIEAYYDNGEFYSDPTTHTSATQLPHERGKIYVDIPTNISYRWGGSSYISIVNPIDVFTGATSSTAGVAGIVPAPAAGDQGKFLRGDGTWATAITSDIKVRQALDTSNKNYPLLFSYAETSSTTTNIDNTSRRNNSIYVNPSTGTVTATNFAGKINNHTVNADVPSNPVFTDTTYALSGTTYDTNNTAQIVTLTPSSGTATYATISAMTGASSSAAGKAGLVPKPAAGDQSKFLTGAGTWATPTNTTYALSGAYGSSNTKWVVTLTPSSGSATTSTVPAMVGATASADGKGGLVAKPIAGNNTKYLRGDATWNDPVEDYRAAVNDNTYTLVLNCTNGNPAS